MAESTATEESTTTTVAIARRVREALNKEGVKVADLTDEQRTRAEGASNGDKAGLRGKALATWIIDGKDSKEQVKEAQANKPPKERKESTRYEPWVRPAVDRGRKLSGLKPKADGSGPEGDETLAYAGPIQHIKVRTVLAKEFGDKVSAGGTVTGGNTTVEKILEAAGVKSQKELKDIATFKADKAGMRPLRPLGQKFGNDGWAKGRYLAAVLVVWIEDLKA